MFQFKEGRLYPDVTPRTLSLKLPEGFWFDTYLDSVATDCITLRTEDKKARVEIEVSSSDGMTTEEAVVDEFEGTPEDEIAGPYPITVSGFHGHCMYCLTELPQYVVFLDLSRCEFHSAFKPSEIYDRVIIIVSVGKSQSGEAAKEKLEAVVQSADIKELIESLRVE